MQNKIRNAIIKNSLIGKKLGEASGTDNNRLAPFKTLMGKTLAQLLDQAEVSKKQAVLNILHSVATQSARGY